MRDYGKIKTAFWTDNKLRPMDSDCKLLAAYLLSGPHTNALGCFHCPAGYIATDLGWDIEQVNETLSKLSAKGFVTVCDDYLWLPKFLVHNKPENANVWKHVRKLAYSLPHDLPELSNIINSLDQPQSVGVGNPSERVSEPYRIPEPEPEPEPKPRKKGGRKLFTPRKGSRLPDDWSLTQAQAEYAQNKYGISDWAVCATDFHEYYTQGAGRNRTHMDWNRVWQRWVRKQVEFKGAGNGKKNIDYREGARNVFRQAGFDVGESGGSNPVTDPNEATVGEQAEDIPGDIEMVGRTDHGPGNHGGPEGLEVVPDHRGDSGAV